MFQRHNFAALFGLVALAGLVLIPLSATADGGTIGKMRAYQVTCDSTPRSLKPASGYSPPNGLKFVVASATVFIGGSDVDTSTKGFPYTAGTGDSYDAKPDSVFCVSAGTATVTVLAGGF